MHVYVVIGTTTVSRTNETRWDLDLRQFYSFFERFDGGNRSSFTYTQHSRIEREIIYMSTISDGTSLDGKLMCNECDFRYVSSL